MSSIKEYSLRIPHVDSCNGGFFTRVSQKEIQNEVESLKNREGFYYPGIWKEAIESVRRKHRKKLVPRHSSNYKVSIWRNPDYQ